MSGGHDAAATRKVIAHALVDELRAQHPPTMDEDRPAPALFLCNAFVPFAVCFDRVALFRYFESVYLAHASGFDAATSGDVNAMFAGERVQIHTAQAMAMQSAKDFTALFPTMMQRTLQQIANVAAVTATSLGDMVPATPTAAPIHLDSVIASRDPGDVLTRPKYAGARRRLMDASEKIIRDIAPKKGQTPIVDFETLAKEVKIESDRAKSAGIRAYRQHAIEIVADRHHYDASTVSKNIRPSRRKK